MESKNLIYLVTEYAANGELLGRKTNHFNKKKHYELLLFNRFTYS